MKLWATRKTMAALRAQVQDQMQALWNRNELIALQDEAITDLRRENKTLQQDVTTLRNALEACGRERDHLLGKAANP